jgi:hypothetical protein
VVERKVKDKQRGFDFFMIDMSITCLRGKKSKGDDAIGKEG